MKFALFLAGSTLVGAQSCFLTPIPNCTANNCTVLDIPGSCTSNSTCDTSSKTCSGTGCSAGSMTTNYKTCSTCGPTCAGKAAGACDSAVCEYKNGTSFCTNPPTPQPEPHCIMKTTQAACTAVENCFWASFTPTVCGKAWPAENLCLPCNNTQSMFTTEYTDEMRSGVKNLVGKTCTHAKAGEFDSAFSYSINSYGANAMCNATMAAMDAMDRQYVSEFVRVWYPSGNTAANYMDTSSNLPTCVTTPAPSNDASALLPGAAVLIAASLLA